MLFTVLSTLVAGLLSTGAALRGAFAFSEAAKARRGARAKLRQAGSTPRAMRAEEVKREARLDGATRRFTELQQEARTRAVSVEELKQEGAERVRWDVLKAGGYATLADVERAGAAELERLDGIGETSAKRILAAAEKARRRIAGEPPALPKPDLGAEGSLAVAREGLELLDLRREYGPHYRDVLAEWNGYRAQVEASAGAAGFVPWVRSLVGKRDLGPPVQRLKDLQGELDEWADAPRHAALEHARKRGAKRVARQGEEIRRGALLHWPELIATVEQSMTRLAPADRRRGGALQGRVPAEIAARCEAFPLQGRGLDVTLRGYQRFGACYLLVQERTILGDEMGLGKTIEALAAMTHVWNEQPRARFLTLAPAGLIWNWAREVERRAPFPAHVLHGDHAADAVRAWREQGGLAVTSYATLRNLGIGRLLADRETLAWLFADEAHYLKNPEARRTQAAAEAIERAERVCLMSGTPLENHPREFVQLIRSVRPGVADELESGAGSDEVRDPRSFHERAAAVYLRRNQEDVLSELPERIEVEEWVDLEYAEELEAYREAVAARGFMAMRRATTVAPGSEAAGEKRVSSKLDRLEELLDDHRASGRKVIVFSFFLDVLAAVSERFGCVGTISGALAPAERMRLVDVFDAAPAHALLLLQIDAGGTGFNLQQAGAVVLMEPQLKPTTEAQAVARAHRMGQTQRVVVHRLLARGTVDERLVELLAEKQDLFDAYARESSMKGASREATETKLVERLIDAERERLGLGPRE